MKPSPTDPTTTPPPEFLRAGPMAQALGIKKSTFFELVKREGFPPPSRLSSVCVLYPRRRVLDWVAGQAMGVAA